MTPARYPDGTPVPPSVLGPDYIEYPNGTPVTLGMAAKILGSEIKNVLGFQWEGGDLKFGDVWWEFGLPNGEDQTFKIFWVPNGTPLPKDRPQDFKHANYENYIITGPAHFRGIVRSRLQFLSQPQEQRLQDFKAPSDTLLSQPTIETQDQFAQDLERQWIQFGKHFKNREEFETFAMLPLDSAGKQELLTKLIADRKVEEGLHPETGAKRRK